MAWTPWRKIADKLFWYVEHGLHLPVCFELGVASLRGLDEPRVVYAGAAPNESRQLVELEAGHPLSGRIRAELDQGQALFYRATGAPNLPAAEALLAERLAGGSPPWND